MIVWSCWNIVSFGSLTIPVCGGDGGMVGWWDGWMVLGQQLHPQFVPSSLIWRCPYFPMHAGYPQSSSIYRWIFHDQLAIGDPPWRHGHPKNDPPKKSLGHHYRGATITWMWESLVARNLPWLKNDKHSSHKHGDDLGMAQMALDLPHSRCLNCYDRTRVPLQNHWRWGVLNFWTSSTIGVQAKICIQELERSSNVTVCYRK